MNEANNQRIVRESLPFVRKRLRGHCRIGVRNEYDTLQGQLMGSYIKKLAGRLLPYGVQFGLNENSRPLINTPSQKSLSPSLRNCSVNHLETLQCWSSWNRSTLNKLRRSARNNAFRERTNLRCDYFRT